ncbi:MAG: hypothetical protein JWO33_100 [Caulobacteraceae bacterium]|nr:hypothetical protein [Caulobacteraceae bacterium]
MQIVGLAAMSHTPSWDMSPDHKGPGERFVAAVMAAKRQMAALNPTAFVVFGPDHFRNFFYDVMPAFCIGAEKVEGFGDYSSPKGAFPGNKALGRFIVDHVMADGFDPAVSLNMSIDHGMSQPYAALNPKLDMPITPILINCGGGPMPSPRRCYEFGQAVGRAIRAAPGEGRVVVVGSGGLSHSPPSVSPDDAEVSADNRDYVINGRARAQEFNAMREAQSIERRKVGGVGPINEPFDHWFLDHVKAQDMEPVASLGSDELLEKGGVGGQEIRAWIAALGAWGGPIDQMTYEPVPTWITGMGCITGVAPQKAA